MRHLTAFLLAFALLAATAGARPQPAPNGCGDDCGGIFYVPMLHRSIFVQYEYLPLINRFDCLWWEDGSALCGEDR